MAREYSRPDDSDIAVICCLSGNFTAYKKVDRTQMYGTKAPRISPTFLVMRHVSVSFYLTV